MNKLVFDPSEITLSLGKNGEIQTTGLELYFTPRLGKNNQSYTTVAVYPITSKKVIGKCKIEFPLSLIDDFYSACKNSSFTWEDRLNNVRNSIFQNFNNKIEQGYGYEYEHVIDDLAFETLPFIATYDENDVRRIYRIVKYLKHLKQFIAFNEKDKTDSMKVSISQIQTYQLGLIADKMKTYDKSKSNTSDTKSTVRS